MIVRIILYLFSWQFIWNFDNELEAIKRNGGIGRSFYTGLGLTILSSILIIGDFLFVFNHNIWLFGIGLFFSLLLFFFSFLQFYYFDILNKYKAGKIFFDSRKTIFQFLRSVLTKDLIKILPTRMPGRIDFEDTFLICVQKKANFFLYLSWVVIFLIFTLLLVVRFHYTIL